MGVCIAMISINVCILLGKELNTRGSEPSGITDSDDAKRAAEGQNS
jgi:hypothetical protein